MNMVKYHICNICGRAFKADEVGRIQIIKKLERGKIEFWICSKCADKFKERVKDLIDIR